jgi:hypothetical protein
MPYDARSEITTPTGRRETNLEEAELRSMV